MKIPKTMKHHLDAIAQEVAATYIAGCKATWPEIQQEAAKDGVEMSHKECVVSDWNDNGYEIIDDLNDVFEKLVSKHLKLNLL